MLTGAYKTQNGFGFNIFRVIQKDGDRFLNHIIQVTGDETWVSFVSVETKEQSKHWMHIHSPNKPKKFKQTLPACQKADGNCFLGQEMCDGGIYATRDHNNIRCVLRNTKKKLRRAI
jgi:hypothetical protein